jgi:hypothetical protein
MGFRRVSSSILWSVFVVVVLIGGLCPDGTSAFPSGYDEVEGHNGDSDANTVVETGKIRIEWVAPSKNRRIIDTFPI